jgi:hypothetical protein
MWRLALVSLVTSLSACDSPSAPTVRLNEEFVLQRGEAATIGDTGIRIRFVGVQGDSRCPADVVCIQGGDAIVRIEVTSASGPVATYDLHTGDMRPVVHGSLTIALVQLSPYPFSTRPIQPGEYRATLRVTG